jgi:hypothetical protein
MNALLQIAGAGACGFIVLACICRINLMRYGTNKLGWMALYILYAPFAGGMLLDLLTEPAKVEWWACVGVAGIAMHLVLTRRHWSMGAPIYTELRS